MKYQVHTLSKYLLLTIAVFYPNLSAAFGGLSASESRAIEQANIIRTCLTEVEKSLNTYSLDKNLAYMTERLNSQLQINLQETAELLQTVNQHSSSFDDVDLQVLGASDEAVKQAISFGELASPEKLLLTLIDLTLKNAYPESCLINNDMSASETLIYQLNQMHVYFNAGLAKADLSLISINKRLRAIKKKQLSDPTVTGLTRI